MKQHRPLVRAAFTFLAALAASPLSQAQDANSDASLQARNTAGRATVYQQMDQASLETLTTPDRLMNVAKGGFAPTEIWRALEHGEKVECLDCIAPVSKLLYDDNAKTREISAWWLRRRIFGVFGPGQVYERTLGTLASDGDPKHRAYAAYALGEFLALPGIEACAKAVTADPDASVRAAAASALGRLNDDGKGALAAALKDGDARVKIAALQSAGIVNTFTGVAEVSALTGDGDAVVRRRAIEVLDQLRAKDAVASVAALAKNDPDTRVRIAACHALGSMGDPSAKPTLDQVSQSDASQLVRDQARIALRRL